MLVPSFHRPPHPANDHSCKPVKMAQASGTMRTTWLFQLTKSDLNSSFANRKYVNTRSLHVLHSTLLHVADFHSALRSEATEVLPVSRIRTLDCTNISFAELLSGPSSHDKKATCAPTKKSRNLQGMRAKQVLDWSCSSGSTLYTLKGSCMSCFASGVTALCPASCRRCLACFVHRRRSEYPETPICMSCCESLFLLASGNESSPSTLEDIHVR